MFQGFDRFVRGFFGRPQSMSDGRDLRGIFHQPLFEKETVFILNSKTGVSQWRIILDGEIPGDKNALDPQFFEEEKDKLNERACLFVLLFIFGSETGT